MPAPLGERRPIHDAARHALKLGEQLDAVGDREAVALARRRVAAHAEVAAVGIARLREVV